MKDKILFFVLGAVCMWLITQLIVKDDSLDVVITKVNNGEVLPSTQPSPPDSPSQAKPPEQKAPSADETPSEVTSTSNWKSSFTMSAEKQEELQSMMRTFKLQKMRKKFSGLFDQGNPKLDQLLLLADAKLTRESTIMQSYMSGSSMDEAIELQTIMSLPEDELTPEQRQMRAAQIERGERLASQLEQSRIEFEDAIKNLLSPSELNQFKQQEQQTSQRAYERNLNAIKRNILLDSDTISEYQSSQVESIVNRYARESLNDITLGTSISSGPFSSSQQSHERIAKMYEDLERLLGADYVQRARSRPFMMSEE